MTVAGTVNDFVTVTRPDFDIVVRRPQGSGPRDHLDDCESRGPLRDTPSSFKALHTKVGRSKSCCRLISCLLRCLQAQPEVPWECDLVQKCLGFDTVIEVTTICIYRHTKYPETSREGVLQAVQAAIYSCCHKPSVTFCDGVVLCLGAAHNNNAA